MKKYLFAALTIVFAMNLFSFVAAEKKVWDVPAKYKAMKIQKKGDAASVALGKTLYTKYCKSCHGGGGKGDGPKASALNTKMDDFTSAAFKALPDGSKYYMSFVGRGDMPNFEKKVVDEEERWAIINYMNSL
jgi:mono/diheme cytochrome c family protein